MPVETQHGAMAAPGKDVLVRVHVVSQYRGWKQAGDILNKAVELLRPRTGALPTVPNHRTLGVWYTGSPDAYEEVVEGIRTRHLVSTVRLWVEQSNAGAAERSAIADVLKGVYDTLNVATFLAAGFSSGGVFDSVPQNTPYPYTVLE